MLLICDRQGLIGKELFAIDGVKLPSNASKEKSGTRADFLRQAERMEKAAEKMIGKHQQADASQTDEVAAKCEAKQLDFLQGKRDDTPNHSDQMKPKWTGNGNCFA